MAKKVCRRLVESSNRSLPNSYASKAAIHESQSSTDESAYIDAAATDEPKIAADDVYYTSQAAIRGSQPSTYEFAYADEATT